jgi:cysteine desulfurase
MLTLTKKTEYGLIALHHLARHRDRLWSARELAEEYRVPLSILTNILKCLTRAQIVASTRGAQGGYQLARSAENISLLELIGAIEGPYQFVRCVGPADTKRNGHQCPVNELCPVRHATHEIHRRLVAYLENIKLADVIDGDLIPDVCVSGTAASESAAITAESVIGKEPLQAMKRIYLDNNATTPLDPRVLERMMPYLTNEYGNAASRNHAFGWTAEEAVENARAQVAKVIGAGAKEIIWTSGATESNNIAILGAARMYQDKGKHIITCNIEHKAVIDPGKYLAQNGFEVTFLDPDGTGRVSAEQVREAMREDTILVSLMFANNEIGTVHPVAEIGALCKERGVLFHTDATQAFGKLPIDVEAMGIDLLSFSGHKIYGPKGVGGLYVRRKKPRVRLQPIHFGGGHERGMRSGTLNVPGIVGLGAAAEIAETEMAEAATRLAALRDRLWDGLNSQLTDIALNGNVEHRLPNTLNVSFLYVEGESLMMGFNDIAVSSGSACTSASLEPSYVLKGIGVGDDLAHSSIRFSMGRFTTEEEIDYTIERVVASVNHLRSMSPLYEMAQEGIDLSTVQWAAH